MCATPTSRVLGCVRDEAVAVCGGENGRRAVEWLVAGACPLPGRGPVLHLTREAAFSPAHRACGRRHRPRGAKNPGAAIEIAPQHPSAGASHRARSGHPRKLVPGQRRKPLLRCLFARQVGSNARFLFPPASQSWRPAAREGVSLHHNRTWPPATGWRSGWRAGMSGCEHGVHPFHPTCLYHPAAVVSHHRSGARRGSLLRIPVTGERFHAIATTDAPDYLPRHR